MGGERFTTWPDSAWWTVMTTTELGMSLPTSFGWHDSLVTSSWSTYSPIDTLEKANRWTPARVLTVLSGKGAVRGRDDDY